MQTSVGARRAAGYRSAAQVAVGQGVQGAAQRARRRLASSLQAEVLGHPAQCGVGPAAEQDGERAVIHGNRLRVAVVVDQAKVAVLSIPFGGRYFRPS